MKFLNFQSNFYLMRKVGICIPLMEEKKKEL